MSFVFPALLGGLLLTGVPVLLHLIMRRKPKRQPFPAFRYLVKRHRNEYRRLRLRHLMLLALRIGLIVAICLALARPRALNERLQLSSDRAVAAVFVFDTSFSMEYAVGNRSRLDEAKHRALEWLDELPEGSRVAVLDSAENVQSGRGEWLANLVQARERINRLRLKPANHPVTTRLQSAYRLFAELAQSKSPEQNLPRLLCVFSDRTQACWDAGKLPELFEARDAVPPPLELLQKFRDEIPALLTLLSQWPPNLPPPTNPGGDAKGLADQLEKLRDHVGTLQAEDYPDRPTGELLARVSTATRGVLAQVRPEIDKAEPAVREYREKLAKALQEALTSLRGVHEVFVDVGAERPDDLAIVGLDLPRLAFRNQPRQVFNADEKFLLQAVVKATGRDFSQMLVAFLDQKRLPTQPAVELKAGEKKTVPIEIDTKDLTPGPHQVEVRLAAPDAMPFNNTRQVTFLIREPRKVLIVTDEPENAGRWKLALDLNGTGPYRCEVVKADADKLRPDFLAPFVAVYLMSVKEPRKELWEALENYVQRGGGLGVIPGDDKQLDMTAYADPVAKRLLPGSIEGIASSEDAQGDAWDFGKDAIFQHPLLRPFRDWRNVKTIDFTLSPRKANFYWVVKPTKDTNVLVRYAGKKNRPALLESAVSGQGGKVLLFTTPFDLSETNPPWNDYIENLNSFYLVLATLATNYLAGDVESIPLNFVSGQTPPALPRSFTGRLPAYQLRGPSLTETISVGDDQTDVQFPQASAPGNYAVEDMEGRPVALFSVNMPLEESSLDQVPAEQIEALFGPRSVVPINYRSNLKEELYGHWRQPVELFPALMVALLLLLAFENLLANKFYKRDPAAEKEEA